MIIALLKGTALPLRLHAPPGALPPSSWVYFYLSLEFAHAYRQQFLRYRDEIVQAHCHRGGIGAFVKIWGVGPPWREIFSQIFFRNFDLKIQRNHAQGPRKKTVKKFLRSEP